MANTLKIKRGLAASIPQGQLAEPLFTTDTYDLYIGKGSGGNQRIQNYIASGTSSQFLKGDGSLDSTTYQATSEKGQNNGYASLDAGGKIPASQLPSSVIEYKGTWNASTNTPTLADGTGDAGDVYIVSVGGTQNLGSGSITFDAGDWVMYNGSVWQKSINSNAVASVNGQTGAVVLYTDDISEDGSPTNLWFTNARARAALSATSPVQYNNSTGVISILDASASQSGVVTTGTQTFAGEKTFQVSGTYVDLARFYNDTNNKSLFVYADASGTGLSNLTSFGGESIYFNRTGTEMQFSINGSLRARLITGGRFLLGSQFYTDDGVSLLQVNGQIRAGFTAATSAATRIVTVNSSDVMETRTPAQILSDIGVSSTYVPYTGATTNVNIGTNSMTAFNFYASSTYYIDSYNYFMKSILELRDNATSTKRLYITADTSESLISTVNTVPLKLRATSGVTEQVVLNTNGTISFTGAATFSSSVTTGGDIISTKSVGFTLKTTTVGAWTAVYGDTGGLYLGTNAGNWMFINNSGNVGIGAASPSVKLHVYGVNEIFRLETTATTGSNYFLFRSPSADMGYIGYGASGNNNITLINYLNADMTFGTNSAERMRITSGGNVGIGTTNPSGVLHVIKDGAGNANTNITGSQLILSRTTGASENIAFRNTGTSAGISGLTYAGQIISDGNNGFEIFTDGSSPFIFGTSATERMRITSGGNVGINTSGNTTSTPHLFIGTNMSMFNGASDDSYIGSNFYYNSAWYYRTSNAASQIQQNGGEFYFKNAGTGTANGALTWTERMRITSGGDVLVNQTSSNIATTGTAILSTGRIRNCVDGSEPMEINRKSSDGKLIIFYQDTVEEGNISVAGSTVSYNGGHLARWTQSENAEKIDGLLKGTVMSNLDKMAEWINFETGEPYANEQLNCMKISDIEGDINVAGVFVNYDNDNINESSDMNIAMTGDMIIRIAQGVLVEKGQLLMSAGDGTAKPQEDDIIRAKTIAKVTSNHVTCVYEDGSYCVPCVLMAC